MESLKDKFIGLQNTIRGMREKDYTIKSEYHRLMYRYTLELEIVQAAINSINEEA